MRKELYGLTVGIGLSLLSSGCVNQKNPSVYSWEARNRTWDVPETFITDEYGRVFYSVTRDNKHPVIAEVNAAGARFIDYGNDGVLDKMIFNLRGKAPEVYSVKNKCDKELMKDAQAIFDDLISKNIKNHHHER